MKRLTLLTIMLLAVSVAHAWQHDLEVRSEVFSDNDGTHSFGFDELVHWKDDATRFGLGATQTFINDSEGNRDYVGGILEGYRRQGIADFTARLRLVDWNDEFKSPVSLASSQQLGRFRLEESVDYGFVDSVAAYDAEIDFWTVGGEIDVQALDNLTFNAGYWRRWTSDDNERDSYLGRAIFDFNDRFHLQYRYRGFRNDVTVTQYYSPRRFDQHALLVGYFDSFFDRLRVKLWVGPVVQNEGDGSDFGMLENAQAVWKISDTWSMNARIEANQVGSGYQYVYGAFAIDCNF